MQSENLKGKDHLGDLDIEGNISFKDMEFDDAD
jgi:hypothetical protein